MEHLRSDDHRLFGLYALLDETTLYAGNLLLRYFDSEVSAGNHHTVCNFENLIDIIDTFLIFDFSNDFYLAVMSIENFLYSQNILAVTHKRMCDKVDILINGIKNITTVFLGKGRQIDTHTRYIHALSRSQLTGILRYAQQVIVVFFEYTELQFTVVDEHDAVHRKVFGKIDIRHIDCVVRGKGIGISCHTHDVAGSKRDASVVFDKGGSHFGAFRIHENSDRIGNGPHVIYDTIEAFGIEVGRVHSHHIHTVFVKRAHEIYFATFIRNRGNNLGLF